MEGPSACGPFTACFVNCYLSVGFLTRDEARDPGSTIFVTHSQSTLCCVGIETVRISTPNFRFCPPTWAIRTFWERSAIFISPRNFFLRSQRESMWSLVRSFRGGSSHETDRFLRSRDDLFDPLPGRTAQCEPQHDQGIPRRVYSPAAILPRCPGNRSGKTAPRTARRFLGGSVPGLLGKRKALCALYTKPSPGCLARILPISSVGRTGPHAPVPKNHRPSSAATRPSYGWLSFQRGLG